MKRLLWFTALLLLANSAHSMVVVDDFESGLPTGTDSNGVPIGFYTFADASSVVNIATTTTPPVLVPGSSTSNTVLRYDYNTTAFSGFLHYFENAAIDTWVSQDWSAFDRVGFFLYGSNSGTQLFFDILDNRNPGSTADDAERYTTTFIDAFVGWQFLEFSFVDFTRKEVGNGAPNDGLGLTEVHGWAFGNLSSGGLRTLYLDDVKILAEQIPVPIPLALMGLGLVGIGFARKKKQH